MEYHTPEIYEALMLIVSLPVNVQQEVEACLKEYIATFEKYKKDDVAGYALALFGAMVSANR